MTDSCTRAAEATFTALANCYWREADPGAERTVTVAPDTTVRGIAWRLKAEGVTLFAEVLYRSLTGPHRFGRLWKHHSSDEPWQTVDPLWATLLLVRESYARAGCGDEVHMRQQELDLIGRVVASCQAMRSHLDGAGKQRNEDGFIEAEQSLVFGHWLHPTPKSRMGMSEWQEAVYAPETGGRFPLALFAVDRTLLSQDSALRQSAAEIVLDLYDDVRHSLRPGEALLPAHPLQAEALLLDARVKALVETGRLRRLELTGPLFTATSSVRTVYSPDASWMLKFSLPVRITNSLRINRAEELQAGVAMARLFDRTSIAREEPLLNIVADPAYLTIALPGAEESGFEVILRHNSFDSPETTIVTVAALTADTSAGRTSRLGRLVERVALDRSLCRGKAARLWFDAYLDCALDPAIRLYDRHGIALEAHQQNSLLDVRDGLPSSYYYRDNQGYYLSNAHRSRLTAVLPELGGIPSLFYDDTEIRDWFAYYLIVNQVFSVISRLGRDGYGAEVDLIDLLRARLSGLASTLDGVGSTFVRRLLERPLISSKANLMTGVHQIDEFEDGPDGENTIFAPIRNPIFMTAANREARHAVAS